MSAVPIVLGITIRADGSAQVSGELNRVRDAVTSAGSAAQNTNREFANMARNTQALSNVMGAFGVTLGLAGFVMLARDMARTVEQVQNLSIRLKGLTKGTQDYNQVQEYLIDISTRHHKSNLVLADSFSRLLVLEQSGIINRKQSIILLEGMSNASSKTGATTEQLKQVMFGFSQAMGSGVVHMEELNQISEPMPGLLNKIAISAGYTTGEFRKLVGDGRITSDVFGRVMVNAFASYEGAAAKAGETITAKYADISNAWVDLATALEKPVAGTLTTILEAATWQLGQFAIQARYVKSVWADIFGTPISGGAGDNGMTVDLTGRAKPPTVVDPAIAATKSIHDEIEATAKSTAGKKANEKASSDAQSAAKKAANEAIKNYESAAKSADDFMQKLKDAASLSSLSATQQQDFAAEQIAQKMQDANISSQLQVEFLTQAHEQIVVNEALSKSRKIDEVILSGMAALKDKYDQLTLSASAYYAKTLENQHLSPEQAAPLIQQNNLNIKTEISNKKTDDAKSALDAYNKSLDDAHVKTSDLGAVTSAVFDGALGGIHAVAGAFDGMVNSIAANTKALDENAKMQALNDSTKDPAEKAANVAKYAKEEAKLNADNTKAQLTGASQIAGAAAKLFDQKSMAAKAFHAIEVTLSIARLAMDAKEIAMSVIKTGKNLIAGASAMFRDLGPWGFAGVAAMAAVMAGLGFAMSGGSSSNMEPPKTDTGTGTVLGDKSAVSESVTKTWDLLKSIHASEYSELRGINTGISALKTGTASTIDKLFQSGGLTNVATPNISGWESFVNAMGPFWQGLFGSAKKEITGSGIQTGAASVGDIMSGQGIVGQQYATVKKTVSSWFGSDKVSYSEILSGLDASITDSLTMVYKAMGSTMLSLATAFGGDLSAQVNATIIPALKVELRGLSGADAAKVLNGVISATLDTMATNVFGGILKQYQQLGEGMLETAIRIASEIAVVKDALATSGLSLAANAIAISDALVQAAGGLAEFQKQFTAYFDKFYTNNEKQAASYTSLSAALLTVLAVLPQTRDGYRQLIEGLDLQTASGQKAYTVLLSLSAAADTYYTALDAQTKTYTDAIATAKSNLATAYKTESDAITATISKLSSFVASLKTLKDSLALGNLSTGTPLDKYNEARRQAGDAYNTIQGGAGTTTASKSAYDAAVGSINTKLTTFLDASKTYNASGSGYTTDYQQVMGLIDSMGLAATAQQTDAEKQLEQLTKSVDGLLTINTSVLSVKDALAGVTSAIVSLQTLQAERDKADAAAKQAVTQAGIDRAAADKAAAEAAARSADYAAARMQVTQLVAAYQAHPSAAGSEAVNSYLRSIAGRFDESYNPNLKVSAEGMWTLTPKFATGGAHTGGWRIVGEHGPELEHTGPSQLFSNAQSKTLLGSDNKALQEVILELRAVRAEVEKLRAEQRDNTGALIQSNYDANDLAAEKVVAGGKDTAKQTAWANNSKAVIA